MGRSGCPAKKKNFFGGGVSLQAKTFELFPTVEYHPHQKIESTCLLITDHILEKKILIAFRQILSKILLEACIFSNTIMAYLKKKKKKNSLELNSLVQNSIQQDYLPKLYPIVSLSIHGKPWRWGRIPPNNEKSTHLSHQKNPLIEIYFLHYQKCHSIPTK